MKPQEIITAISRRHGIERLNEMQRQMLESTENAITVISPTGSGKTLAFACRMLKELSVRSARPQAVVIAPSRELAMQIFSVVRPIAQDCKTVALYGGHSMSDEKNSLHPLPDIIIATPGRLLDHLQRGHLDLYELGTLVLDEYDKSLELGFEGEMRRIISRIKKIRTIILTSATSIGNMPDYLRINNPRLMDFSGETHPESRMQTVEVTSFTRDKLDTLTNLLQNFRHDSRTIVFVNHRESAERVYSRLRADKIAATLYHGALDQQQRTMAIDLFTNGTAPVLVATDLAARGLDIADIENIIHYHLPASEQIWTHRNGRTARRDATGSVWVILSEADNRPDFIAFDRTFIPQASDDIPRNRASRIDTLYLSAGKKEKISRGDVAGFIAASGVTLPSEIGKIQVHDHHSVVAVPSSKAKDTVTALSAMKLKGKKVRVSIVRL